MPEEEKPGAGTPPPASEEKPQGEKLPESADQKVELESLKKGITDRDERIKQAEWNIQQLKQKLKDAGIEDVEGSPEIAELKTLIGTLQGEITKMKEEFSNKIAEFGRSVMAKISASSGGEAGQEPPEPEKGSEEPPLSPEDKKILGQGGFKWDPKRKGFVSPTGRFRAWDDKTGIVAPPTP